ncbi:MAG: hypothetical protein M3N22_03550 [Acidobacteriota bacterium]|nr:hypothetical protein [Acidobacteriota bacterium]
MRRLPVLLHAICVTMLAACTLFFAANATLAQQNNSQRKPTPVQLTDADRSEAEQSTLVFRKAWSGNRAESLPQSKLVIRAANQAALVSTQSVPAPDGTLVLYQGDLQYHHGKVIDFAESHDIYMLPNGHCPIATCWGNPESFLRDLAESEFIHVTDQYVGQHAGNRYTLGESASVSYTPPPVPLTDADIQGVVHAVATKAGDTGYHDIYHVFLPPGQDECFDATFTVCASNIFCAYHSSVTFKDIGHVLYSVEPYANVLGCQVRPGTPNGTLIDSTNSVLSHELIETITDPDGDAWWNSRTIGNFGQEIGDECVFLVPGPFTDPAIITVDGRSYALQPEYSNSDHACTADR